MSDTIVTVDITRGMMVQGKWYDAQNRLVPEAVAQEMVAEGAATILTSPEPTPEPEAPTIAPEPEPVAEPEPPALPEF